MLFSAHIGDLTIMGLRVAPGIKAKLAKQAGLPVALADAGWHQIVVVDSVAGNQGHVRVAAEQDALDLLRDWLSLESDHEVPGAVYRLVAAGWPEWAMP